MLAIDIYLEKQGLHLSAQQFRCIESLNQPYTFLLDLTDPIEQPLCGNPIRVTLQFSSNGPSRHFHGIVFEQSDRPAQLLCRAWLAWLDNDRSERRFVNRNSQQIVQAVLQPLQQYRYDVRAIEHAQPLVSISQYHESSLQFLNRLCQQQQIYYWFVHTAEHSTLIFSDQRQSFTVNSAPHWQHYREHRNHQNQTLIHAITHRPQLKLAAVTPCSSRISTHLYHHMHVNDHPYSCAAELQTWPPCVSAITKARMPSIQLATVIERQPMKIRCRFDWHTHYDAMSSEWINVTCQQFTPDIHHRVVIIFNDGDPDHALAIGSIYTDTNKPSYALPHYQHSISLTSRTKNELSLLLTEQQSTCLINSKRHYIETSHAKRSQTITHSMTIKVDGNYSINVTPADYTLTCQQAIQLNCGNSRLSIQAEQISLESAQIELI